MKGILKSGTIWFAVSAGLLLVAGVVSSIVLWDWLHPKESTTVSNGETVRNLGLLIGGVLAFVFALWRGWVAERQAATAQRQAEIAQQQAATAERGLLNERYQRGAEMLGRDVLAVRLGGIYALQRLAAEHPEEYHVQIMKLFCAFVRHPTRSEKSETRLSPKITHSPRQDVNEVMRAIGTRNDVQLAIERQIQHSLDLHGADLRNQMLYDLDLSGSALTGANLSDTFLSKTNLSGANLFHADLSGAQIGGANFAGAIMAGVNLSHLKNCYGTNFINAHMQGVNLTDANLSGAIVNGAMFHGANIAGAKFFDESGMMVEGLTLRQIVFAKAIPDNKPPCLDGIEDAETGELIYWADRPKVIAGRGPHSQTPTGTSQKQP